MPLLRCPACGIKLLQYCPDNYTDYRACASCGRKIYNWDWSVSRAKYKYGRRSVTETARRKTYLMIQLKPEATDVKQPRLYL